MALHSLRLAGRDCAILRQTTGTVCSFWKPYATSSSEDEDLKGKCTTVGVHANSLVLTLSLNGKVTGMTSLTCRRRF